MNSRTLPSIFKILCRTSAILAVVAFALPGCGTTTNLDGGGVFVNPDASGDGGAIGDAAADDATPGSDTALADAAADVIVPDAGPKDTAIADSGPADSGPKDTGPADTGPADTGPADTATVCKTDYTQVQTILTQNCNGCHGHQFGSGCSYATGSKTSIKSKVSGGSMPPGGFSNSADKALVLKWISDGAACTPAAGCP